MNFKTILACAALLIGIGTATAAVESDIVGYTSRTIPANTWTLVGVNFVDLEDEVVDGIPVFSMISGNFAQDDEIQIQKTDGAGYDRARWNADVNAWCTINIRTGKVTTTPSTLTLVPGQGFWIKTSATDLQIAGKVYAGNAIDVKIGSQYRIFSPTIPADISINSDLLVWSNFSENDEIQVPKTDGAGYDRARWNAELQKWCTINIRTGKVTTTPSPLQIASGSSIWVISTNGASTVTIASAVN